MSLSTHSVRTSGNGSRPLEPIDQLCISIANSDFNSVSRILSGGVELNAISSVTGDTPLKAAVQNEDRFIASLLVEAGASPDYSPNGLSPLQYACLHSLEEMQSILLSVQNL